MVPPTSNPSSDEPADGPAPATRPSEIPRGLPRRQANLLAALASLSSLTRREYQAVAGICHTTAHQDIAELLTSGLIVRLGAARACRYALPVPLPPAAE